MGEGEVEKLFQAGGTTCAKALWQEGTQRRPMRPEPKERGREGQEMKLNGQAGLGHNGGPGAQSDIEKWTHSLSK